MSSPPTSKAAAAKSQGRPDRRRTGAGRSTGLSAGRAHRHLGALPRASRSARSRSSTAKAGSTAGQARGRQGRLGMSGSISDAFHQAIPIATSLVMVGILFVGVDRLSEPAGRAAAEGRLPHHPGLRPAARRQRRDHGLLGRPAAGAPVRADPRRHRRRHPRAVSASTSMWRCSSTSIATSTRRPTTSRRPSMPRAVSCRRDLPSPPTYRKVNPADSPILLLSVTSEHPAADRGRRQRRHQAGPADQPDLRRRPESPSAASRSRPSASSSIRPSWWPRTCRWRTCAHNSRSRPSIRRRAASTARSRSYTIYANDQLTAADAWNDVIIAYRNGAPLRVRDIGRAVAGPEDAKKAAWSSGQARRIPGRLQAAGRQRHRDRRSHQERSCRACAPPCRQRSTWIS